MIKARVAHKLQLLIFNDIDVGTPTQAELADWFDRNRARYDVPRKLDFYLAPAASEQAAREALASIAAGAESEAFQGTVRAYQGRPANTVAASFGAPFLAELLAAPPGRWVALRSTEGWHVARLDGVTDGVAATLDDVRAQAIQDWKTEATRRRALEAVEKLKANYTVRYEDAP
jgi:hypothetical protein